MARLVPIAGGRSSALDDEVRRRLARMCVRLLELWRLNRRQQAIMLGLSPDTRSTLRRYAQGIPLSDQRDILDRAGPPQIA